MRVLFIFRPHKKWGYCGGAIIIVAKDLEEADKILRESERGVERVLTQPQEEVEIMNGKGGGIECVDCWVLEKSFEVQENNSYLVLNNYNYA